MVVVNCNQALLIPFDFLFARWKILGTSLEIYCTRTAQAAYQKPLLLQLARDRLFYFYYTVQQLGEPERVPYHTSVTALRTHVYVCLLVSIYHKI